LKVEIKGEIMDKALKMGKTTASGSLNVLLGQVGSTVILAVGTIVMSLFILEGDYGLFAVSLIPVSTVLLFQDWGVTSALIRSCAQCRATNNESRLRRTIIVGLSFEAMTALVLTLAIMLIANFIAFSLFNKPEAGILIVFSSINILSISLTAAVRSIFIGFEQMRLSSYVLILQAVVQSVIGPLLVYLHFGALGAIIGYTSASVLAVAVSIILLYLKIFRKLPFSDNNSTFSQTLRPMLSYGIPLGIAVILGGIGGQIFYFLTARFSANDIIGNYRVALNFGVLISFLTVPISTVLLPMLSKIDMRTEKELLKTVFMSSVKYSAFLLVPATLGMAVLSQPLVATLFGQKWLQAPYLLSLIVMGNLLALIGNYSVVNLFSASGETKLLMKLNLLTLSVGVPLAIVLIPALGVVGMIICSLVSGIPSAFLGLYYAWRRHGVRIDFGVSIRIFAASALAVLATYLFLSFFDAINWVRFAIGVVLFLMVYMIASPVIGAINRVDVRNLRSMFSGLGFISRILNLPLIAMDKILSLLKIED
jgi:stage V sporulation protein B